MLKIILNYRGVATDRLLELITMFLSCGKTGRERGLKKQFSPHIKRPVVELGKKFLHKKSVIYFFKFRNFVFSSMFWKMTREANSRKHENEYVEPTNPSPGVLISGLKYIFPRYWELDEISENNFSLSQFPKLAGNMLYTYCSYDLSTICYTVHIVMIYPQYAILYPYLWSIGYITKNEMRTILSNLGSSKIARHFFNKEFFGYN